MLRPFLPPTPFPPPPPRLEDRQNEHGKKHARLKRVELAESKERAAHTSSSHSHLLAERDKRKAKTRGGGMRRGEEMEEEVVVVEMGEMGGRSKQRRKEEKVAVLSSVSGKREKAH